VGLEEGGALMMSKRHGNENENENSFAVRENFSRNRLCHIRKTFDVILQTAK
jgi:hypothetical protein